MSEGRAPANDRFPYLGAVTEGRFAEAFGNCALATASAAQAVLGLDAKTFRALVAGGAIKSVPTGQNSQRYTEADLRAYLNRETELAPCQSTGRKTAVSGTSTSKFAGSAFTARPARLRVVQPKPSRGNAA